MSALFVYKAVSMVPLTSCSSLWPRRTDRSFGLARLPTPWMERENSSLALYWAKDTLEASNLDGKEAVGIDISKSKGYSTTAVSNKIKDVVAKLQKQLPPGVVINTVRDSGVRVAHSVTNVEEALIEGALLTVLVVFIFLNSWRSTVITGLALPVSVLASFVAVWVVRIHAEHDVAPRTFARDRNFDR